MRLIAGEARANETPLELIVRQASEEHVLLVARRGELEQNILSFSGAKGTLTCEAVGLAEGKNPGVHVGLDGLNMLVVKRGEEMEELPYGVLREVLAERKRQIAKGYTSHHDDEHGDGLIADQAASSISSYHDVMRQGTGTPLHQGKPWVERSVDKEGPSRRRELVQGIALAVAEVERLDRLAEKGW